MSFLNDDSNKDDDYELPNENRKKFLEEIIAMVLDELKQDSHLKLLSIKTKKLKDPNFIKKAMPTKRLTDIFESNFETDLITGSCIVTMEKIKKTKELIIFELKNKIFSMLADERIMALFFNEKTGKMYWAFPDENNPIPDEKDILKRRK